MKFDVIIIGGGPSGLTAAIYLCRSGLIPLVLEGIGAGGQMNYTDIVENYPGYIGSGSELSEKMRTQASKFGAIFSHENVLNIKDCTKKTKTVVTRRNEYKASSVIIATGASPRHLNVTGEEKFTGCGVSYCAVCDGPLFKDKTVMVAGGGNTALTEAIYLSKFCKAVYLVHRRSTFRASAALVDKVNSNPKIMVRTPQVIEEICGDNMVNSVILKNTQTDEKTSVATDAVFIAAGRVPQAIETDEILETNENGFISTDEKMRTNIDGIYAIGDIRSGSLKQIITACADGAIAADCIAGSI